MTEETVRKEYDKLAKIYDLRWNKYIRDTLTFLKNWTEISPQDVVLDVACGTGELEKLLLNEYPSQQIVGIDISENMLVIAKDKCKNFPHVSFYQANVEALPFADNSFDIIVSASALHYFSNPLTALQEMKRVLKPEGKVIILDWCRDFLFCKILNIYLKIFDTAYEQCYTQDEFHCFFEEANFVIYRSNKVRLGLVWGLMVATATKKS